MASRRTARPTEADDSKVGYNGLFQETEAVKRLLMLLLVKPGTTSKEIATVLGVAESGVRTLVPSRRSKKFTFGAGEKG